MGRPSNNWNSIFRRLARQRNGCLVGPWIPNSSGYAKTSIAGRQRYIHNYVWEHYNGPIPEGMLILHHCDNRVCAEITHLFLGTYSMNNRDMIQKGRWGVRPGGRSGRFVSLRRGLAL
jgi:hypothetical protein